MIDDLLLNQIHHVEALELLRLLPDQSIGAIIADPPYGMTELDFDQQVFDWSAFWVEAGRVLETPNNPVVLFSQQPFTTDLINSNRNWWRMEIVVEFTMPVGYLDAKRRPLRCHQNVEVFSAKQSIYTPVFEQTTETRARVVSRKGQSNELYNQRRDDGWVDTGQRYPRDVWRFSQRHSAFHNTKTHHPTEKPPDLMERLVEMFSLEGSVVVDPFVGSGTTAVAARNRKRDFICGDINADYVLIARDRLKLPHEPRETPIRPLDYSRMPLFANGDGDHE